MIKNGNFIVSFFFGSSAPSLNEEELNGNVKVYTLIFRQKLESAHHFSAQDVLRSTASLVKSKFYAIKLWYNIAEGEEKEQRCTYTNTVKGIIRTTKFDKAHVPPTLSDPATKYV